VPAADLGAGFRAPIWRRLLAPSTGWKETGRSRRYISEETGNRFSRGEGETQVAQKISVTFACDYDSREIPEGEHLTRAFSLDGRDYEIDLCEKHSQKFDEVLSRFADKARKVTNRVGKPKRRTTAHRQRSAQIRAWAKQSGMDVSDRGRIPADVIAKYDANH
jgi:hypothetical protein